MESEGILVWVAFKDSSEIGSQCRTRGLQSEMECKMLCTKCWRQGGGRLSEQLKRKDCGVQSKLTLPWLSLGVELLYFSRFAIKTGSLLLGPIRSLPDNGSHCKLANRTD